MSVHAQPGLFEGQADTQIVEVISATGYGLDAQAALVHETAVEKGFWPIENYDATTMHVSDNCIGNKLALVHSEVTEVLEAVRKEQGEAKVVEEFADIIIRCLDLYAALKNTGQLESSLEDVVQLKMRKNKDRPMKHGNRF